MKSAIKLVTTTMSSAQTNTPKTAQKIYTAGNRGMVGSAIVRELQSIAPAACIADLGKVQLVDAKKSFNWKVIG